MNEITAEDSHAREEGHRLHISGLFVGFITGLPNLFFPIIAILFGARSTGFDYIFIPAIIALFLCGSLFFRWLAWTRFRYYIGDEDIRIESGILSRNARSIPYDRIQDVSIEQKPVPRLFGLAEVKFETGSGKGEDGTLSYVTVSSAESLRDLVRARKAGELAGTNGAISETGIEDSTDTSPQLEKPPIFAMDNMRVLTLGFYSFSLVIFAVLFGAAQQFDSFLPFDIWDFGTWIGLAEERGAALNGLNNGARILAAIAALGSIVFIGFATGIIRTFLREYGFRLDENERGFRRRRGLLTLTDVVMPVHRVQAATIFTGPVRKLRGWRGLKFISLAGDSGGNEKGESDHVVAPLATLHEIADIIRAAAIRLPGDDIVFVRSQLAYWLNSLIFIIPITLAGIAALAVYTDAGALAALLLILPLLIALGAVLKWRLTMHAMDEDYLFVRRG